MKKSLICCIIVAIAILAAVSVSYLVLRQSSNTAKTLENPVDFYNKSCSKIRTAEQLELSALILTKSNVNGCEFTESNEQTFRASSLDSEKMKAQRTQTIVSGNHKTELTETYLGGNAYIMLSGCLFSGPCEAQDFLQQTPPPVLLDSANYSHIQGTIQGNHAVISFSGAKQIESWLPIENAKLVDAQGTASIVDSKLIKCDYSITYRVADALVTKQYTVHIADTVAHAIATNVDIDNYTKISSPYAPLALEIAAGYLSQAPAVSAKYEEFILCEAFGDTREKNVNIYLSQQDAWCAKLITSVCLSNTSQTDKAVEMRQTETYINGKHLVSQNGSDPKEDATTTEAALRTYCNELLLGTIILPQHITCVEITQTPSAYRIVYNVNDEFVRNVSHYACNTLYNDASILERIANDEEGAIANCYLEVSKDTLLPLASGVQYTNSYTINGLRYPLIYEARHQYTLPDLNAREQILIS